MKKRKFPTYMKILAGMLAGIIFGLIMVQFNYAPFISDWVKPFGTIFMRLLKFVAIPLVLVSLIKGVANLSDFKSLSSMGLRTLGIYMGTTVIAIIIGISLVSVIQPGKIMSSESSVKLSETFASSATEKGEMAAAVGSESPLQALVDIFPDNAFKAMADNGAMLQIIVIAILFGVAMLMIGREKSAPVLSLIDALDSIIIKMVDIIMLYAPFGVFALISSVVAESAGDFSLLGALGYYAVTVLIGLLLISFGVYPLLLKLFSNVKVKDFLRSILPVQLLAFSTSSSAATLPLSMDTVVRKLGVSQRTASFVLPVGVTINMDGTSCYQAVSAIFIAQILGIDLGWTEILILIATTTLSSIGTPGVPGGAIVVLVMVLSSIGIPAEGLALIIGIERPLDMLRTVTNVTGDVTVASIVDKSQREQA